MRLVNGFSVRADPSRAWEALSDVQTVVTCVPGAEIVARRGEDYDGVVTVKVGPVSMRLSGVVTVIERDDPARRLVVQGRAKDIRGQGGVAATITMEVAHGTGAGSDVQVVTDLDLSGPLGQLGAGMVRQVNRRLIGQFTARLQHLLDGDVTTHPSADPRPAGAVARPRSGAGGWRPVGLVQEVAPVVVGGAVLGLAVSRAIRRALG